MNKNIRGIVDKLYDTFSRYEITLPLNICNECCSNEQEQQLLVRTNLRNLSDKLICTYIYAAKPNPIEINTPAAIEFKYFLPRILDLVSQVKGMNDETTLSYVKHLKVVFSKEETTIVNHFTLEFFKYCLNIYPINGNMDEINSILIMFWKADIDIEPLLEIWSKNFNWESLIHFANMLYEYQDKTDIRLNPWGEETKRGFNPFIENDIFFIDLMVSWVSSNGV